MSDVQISDLRINKDRLWDSLMEMAKIGATEKGGCNLRPIKGNALIAPRQANTAKAFEPRFSNKSSSSFLDGDSINILNCSLNISFMFISGIT